MVGVQKFNYTIQCYPLHFLLYSILRLYQKGRVALVNAF
jgi:hypothetical protein